MRDFRKDKFDLSKSILNAFKLKENSHTVIINNNEITIENEQQEKVIFTFDKLSYDAEIDEVKKFDDFIVAGDTFINLMLLDPFNQLSTFAPNHEIKIEGKYKGRITKTINDGLLFTNFGAILREHTWNQLTVLSTPIDIESLFKPNLYTLEITNADNDLIDSDFKINKVVSSVLVHLAFKEGLYLEINKDFYHVNQKSIQQFAKVEYLVSDNPEPLLYFLSGEKINHPHLKYLEYYHVIEYFFLHSSINKIDKIINELFTLKLSQGSQKSKDNYLEKLTELYVLYGKNQKIYEDEQLRLVINELLGFDALQSFIEMHGFQMKEISSVIFGYAETKIDIGPVVDKDGKFKTGLSLETKQKFCNEVAKRIYRIRNFIVHTKKGEKESIFTPTNENFDTLAQDLNFIRLLSFRLILETSDH